MRLTLVVLLILLPWLSSAQDCIPYEYYYPLSPPYIGIVDTNFAYDVAISGTNAFVADHGSGLRVVSFVDPAAPEIIGEANTPGYAWGVDIESHYAYVADQSGGLQIIDISHPENPSIVGSLATEGSPARLVVQSQIAYVAAGDGDLQIVAVSDPSDPQLLTSLSFEGAANRLVLEGNLLYIACANPYFLHIVDVADVLTPTVRACNISSVNSVEAV